MDFREKHCIINAYVNPLDTLTWYVRGQERLVKSLNYHGYGGDILTWGEQWPMPGYNQNCAYNIKAACFEKAIELGYTTILWLDCSVWCIRPTTDIFDQIVKYGYYAWGSGYLASQTCNDKVLEYFGISRDEAETIPDCSSSMLGINVGNPKGGEFIRRFIQAAKDDMFLGSKYHDIKESADPRFLHSRHDQSVATLLLYQLGMNLTPPGVHSYVYAPTMPETTIFAMMGL